ncbi:MAG: addiction module antidote protein, HigA family [Nitrosomonas sp.]|nr:MAG: addiction module antidote protein, HigA family [Nitrosomonas sp.]
MSKAAEVFSPGDFLAEELESRGWTQIEFAEIIGRPTTLVSGIIRGKKQITPDTAIQLGDALGTGAELWMNLESQYQLSRVKEVSNCVARKARLYERFPVREMIKRGWIEETKNIDILEQQFTKFFNIKSLDEKPEFCHSAKKTNPLDALTGQQLAWLYRVKMMASTQITKSYSEDALRSAIPKLSALLSAPEESRHVSKILTECGVKYVIVEPFPGSKIDGACFWLNETQPVIGLSLRLDRIDNFWFVLRHEIEHVLQGHGKNTGFILDIDSDTDGLETIIEEEKEANLAAAEFCVPKAELDNFYNRVFPLFSEQKVKLFSQRIGVHIGVVVGQLQRRLNRYDFLRAHQVKIRTYATSGALTDGWGFLETN